MADMCGNDDRSSEVDKSGKVARSGYVDRACAEMVTKITEVTKGT